jgi:hypothetical protein
MKKIEYQMKNYELKIIIALILLVFGVYAFIHTSTINNQQISQILLDLVKVI